MRTPQENPKGYDDNSPINHTDKIKGKYLIIHGTADDNVHFQNATQMITALVKSNIDFESAYYPNKNHGISGGMDNTTFHLWSKMTNWIIENMGNENTQTSQSTSNNPKPFKLFYAKAGIVYPVLLIPGHYIGILKKEPPEINREGPNQKPLTIKPYPMKIQSNIVNKDLIQNFFSHFLRNKCYFIQFIDLISMSQH